MTIDEAIKSAREMADFCKSEISTYANLFIKAIDKQPTAYDIDRVVEELEELREIKHKNM